MKNRYFTFFAAIFTFILSTIYCYSSELPDYIPDTLKPWADWVLHYKTQSVECIPHFNNPESFRCAFPASTVLNLRQDGGEFIQDWQIYHETYVPLPGSSSNWTHNVMVDGAEAVVVGQNSIPSVKLSQGSHRVTGSFVWQKLPEYIEIPPESAFVTLKIDNLEINFPNFDDSGRLWLKKATSTVEQKEENRLKVESFRLIDDGIPPQMTIYATLDISGVAREVKLGPLYAPERFIPLTLDTSLPAKLESDATIRIQVKPGRYSFTLKLRHVGQLKELNFDPPDDGYWQKQEIWSVIRRPDLRVVEILGVSAIDPKMTSLPDAWRSYPAYIMAKKETMQFKEIKRGDPTPPPDQLNLQRTLWLAFDGGSYTVQDRITGNKNSGWRLEIEPLIKPGKVTVDGMEQLITNIDSSNNAGVELRRGILNLTAEGKIESSIYTIPATGWIHPFQRVTGVLNLPPGWRLIASTGVDNISGTWIKLWSLLDIFIVLIFTIATAKLFSLRLAAIAFTTLVIIYHEPDAPRYVWLFLLFGFLLLNLTSNNSGKLRKLVKTYHTITVLFLVIIAISYSVQSLRLGIYPQLENRWVSMNDSMERQNYNAVGGEDGLAQDEIRTQEMTDMEAGSVLTESAPSPYMDKNISKLYRSKAKGQMMEMSQKALSPLSKVVQYDPKSLTQTGPGLPLWQPFRSFNFSWSGPVEAGQTISFTLIGPTFNLFLAFIRVALIILLTFGMFKDAGFVAGVKLFKPKGISNIILIAILVSATFTPCLADAASSSFASESFSSQIPSQEMLDELQRRLLEKDRCFPSCADISTMEITIENGKLHLALNVDAAVNTVIPLPGNARHWLSEEVKINGLPAYALFRYEKNIWAMVPKGKNIVLIQGRIGNQSSFELHLPMKPHSGRVVDADGWEVQGVQTDGSLDDQLQFKKIAIKNADAKSKIEEQEILQTGLLPPFALVERTLLLGLDWKVETTVQRLTPTGSAIVLKLPLIAGESVITEGIRVKNGVAEVTLNASQHSISFESFLEISDKIRLYHAPSSATEALGENREWTEIWRLDVSPIFHVETEGIPVILHKSNDRWYPTWHPWSGEEVILKISKPQGIGGQTMTIEKSNLTLYPGQRTTRTTLNLTIKSSQGGQHAVAIPERAELQEVKINGSVQLIRQEGNRVVLPIIPGVQNIEISWKDDSAISTLYKTPTVDLGSSSVNAALDLHISSDRWTLFVGGEQLMGPAVLFWSVVIVILIVSAGLSLSGVAPFKFYEWFLLGIGISMSNIAGCLFVTVWLFVLSMRKKWGESISRAKFNLMQLGIVGLTFIAIICIVFAISQGLLGHPSMNITGNGSSGRLLRWYQDISDPTLPIAWIFSLPMFAYRLAMLAWALWLSFWLISTLKWGWRNFSSPMIWIGRDNLNSSSEKSGDDENQTQNEPEGDNNSKDDPSCKSTSLMQRFKKRIWHQ
ncbi:MAG: hypothetical protein HQK74_08820 [Desulfamplus sp.]|nr:hypothetical protein [Desulfamplus sp.]